MGWGSRRTVGRGSGASAEVAATPPHGAVASSPAPLSVGVVVNARHYGPASTPVVAVATAVPSAGVTPPQPRSRGMVSPERRSRVSPIRGMKTPPGQGIASHGVSRAPLGKGSWRDIQHVRDELCQLRDVFRDELRFRGDEKPESSPPGAPLSPKAPSTPSSPSRPAAGSPAGESRKARPARPARSPPRAAVRAASSRTAPMAMSPAPPAPPHAAARSPPPPQRPPAAEERLLSRYGVGHSHRFQQPNSLAAFARGGTDTGRASHRASPLGAVRSLGPAEVAAAMANSSQVAVTTSLKPMSVAVERAEGRQRARSLSVTPGGTESHSLGDFLHSVEFRALPTFGAIGEPSKQGGDAATPTRSKRDTALQMPRAAAVAAGALTSAAADGSLPSAAPDPPAEEHLGCQGGAWRDHTTASATSSASSLQRRGLCASTPSLGAGAQAATPPARAANFTDLSPESKATPASSVKDKWGWGLLTEILRKDDVAIGDQSKLSTDASVPPSPPTSPIYAGGDEEEAAVGQQPTGPASIDSAMAELVAAVQQMSSPSEPALGQGGIPTQLDTTTSDSRAALASATPEPWCHRLPELQLSGTRPQPRSGSASSLLVNSLPGTASSYSPSTAVGGDGESTRAWDAGLSATSKLAAAARELAEVAAGCAQHKAKKAPYLVLPSPSDTEGPAALPSCSSEERYSPHLPSTSAGSGRSTARSGMPSSAITCASVDTCTTLSTQRGSAKESDLAAAVAELAAAATAQPLPLSGVSSAASLSYRDVGATPPGSAGTRLPSPPAAPPAAPEPSAPQLAAAAPEAPPQPAASAGDPAAALDDCPTQKDCMQPGARNIAAVAAASTRDVQGRWQLCEHEDSEASIREDTCSTTDEPSPQFSTSTSFIGPVPPAKTQSPEHPSSRPSPTAGPTQSTHGATEFSRAIAAISRQAEDVRRNVGPQLTLPHSEVPNLGAPSSSASDASGSIATSGRQGRSSSSKPLQPVLAEALSAELQGIYRALGKVRSMRSRTPPAASRNH